MLYASTRNSLTKSLGSAQFPDTLFATSKLDLTPEAYAAHRKHMAAPQPLSARERELAEAREAERQGEDYHSSRAPRQLHGETPGMTWSDEAKEAIAKLAKGDDRLLVIVCDRTAGFIIHPLKIILTGHRSERNTRARIVEGL